MSKVSKLLLSLLCVGALAMLNADVVLAAQSVTETKDDITITKSAEWTTLNNNKTDESGNPYVNVKFKVDTTKAKDDVVNIVSKGGDADIVIVLDNSGSMGEAFQTAKKVAAEFAVKMIELDTYNVRVGLVTMGSTGIRAVDFTSDKQKISDTILNLQFDPVMWGTNFQEAIYETQNMLASSNAPNKLVVFQSDGIPEQCYKSVNCTNKTGANIALGANDKECAINQTQIMNRLFPDVKMATIGYKTNTSNEEVLYKMASLDASGNKMFYRTEAQATQLVTDLAGAFKKIENTVTNYVYGNSLIDKVPCDYEIMDSSIKVSDNTIKVKADKTQNIVSFTWDKLEKKVYEVSFVIKLLKNKVPTEYFTNKKEIYTNGFTIDVTKDSKGSAKFTYGVDSNIELTSPTVQLGEEVVAPTNPSNGGNNNTTDVNGNDETPATGDESQLLLYGIIMAVSALILVIVGVIVVKKRK